MPYAVGQAYYTAFTTSHPTTEAASNADALPVATAIRNGVDDPAFVLLVVNVATGRYRVTGTIPSTYAAGDVLHVSVTATVGGVSGVAIIDMQILNAAPATPGISPAAPGTAQPMTARDLIRLALLDLQVLAAGENIPAAEAQDALWVLNGLLESWNLDSLWVFTVDRSVHPLTAAQASYTVGSGGNFDIARPHRIATVAWRATVSSSEQPLALLADREYEGIQLKAQASDQPRYAYYDMSYPLATISLWPVPSTAGELVLYVWHQVTNFASLDTVISLPPGYERALRANLAVELAASFSATLHPMLLGVALDSKGLLARQNVRIESLSIDSALL